MLKRLITLFTITAMHSIGAMAQGSGNNLYFDGINDMVTIPSNASLDIGNTNTIEFWVNPSKTYYSRLVSRYNGGGSSPNTPGDFLIDTYNPITNGRGLRFYLLGPGNQPFFISYPNVLTLNAWNHVAVSRNANIVLMYVNGDLVGSGTAPFTSVPTNTNPIILGEDRIVNALEFYQGKMDELRIWNVVLSQSDIRAQMCSSIPSSHASYNNLAVYYKFDQGSGLSVTDHSNNSNHGIMNGPVWQTSSAPLGDAGQYATTATSATIIDLAHANGDHLTVNVTAGTASSIYIYRVDEMPAVNTPPAGLDQLSDVNYWGVKAFDAVGLIYEVVYHYDGHPGITDENNLRLASRADNAAVSWSMQSATLNTTSQTLTLGGQTGTEFILGSTGSNTLPIEWLNFDAIAKSNLVELTWSTASELNNDYFEVLRSVNATDWEILGVQKGRGNSSSVSHYEFRDNNPIIGNSYYRIKQVDFNGKFSFSDIKSVNLSSIISDLVVYPNPAQDVINFPIGNNSSKWLKVYNMQGQLVNEKIFLIHSSDQGLQLNIEALKRGVYFIRIGEKSYRFLKN